MQEIEAQAAMFAPFRSAQDTETAGSQPGVAPDTGVAPSDPTFIGLSDAAGDGAEGIEWVHPLLNDIGQVRGIPLGPLRHRRLEGGVPGRDPRSVDSRDLRPISRPEVHNHDRREVCRGFDLSTRRSRGRTPPGADAVAPRRLRSRASS